MSQHKNDTANITLETSYQLFPYYNTGDESKRHREFLKKRL